MLVITREEAIVNLEEEIDDLREVLRPFALLASDLPDNIPDDQPCPMLYSTAGNYRAAAKALEGWCP